MGKPNAMSRRHDLNGGGNDNVNITVLSPQLFRELHICINQGEVDIEGPDTQWYNHIKEKMASRMEPEVQKAIAQKQQGAVMLEDRCITWQGKLYVPEVPELRTEIIASHHDGVTMGHPGQYHMMELIVQNYWWPGMGRDVKSYLFKCQECQRTKVNNQPLQTVLHPHEPP